MVIAWRELVAEGQGSAIWRPIKAGYMPIILRDRHRPGNLGATNNQRNRPEAGTFELDAAADYVLKHAPMQVWLIRGAPNE